MDWNISFVCQKKKHDKHTSLLCVVVDVPCCTSVTVDTMLVDGSVEEVVALTDCMVIVEVWVMTAEV